MVLHFRATRQCLLMFVRGNISEVVEYHLVSRELALARTELYMHAELSQRRVETKWKLAE